MFLTSEALSQASHEERQSASPPRSLSWFWYDSNYLLWLKFSHTKHSITCFWLNFIHSITATIFYRYQLVFSLLKLQAWSCRKNKCKFSKPENRKAEFMHHDTRYAEQCFLFENWNSCSVWHRPILCFSQTVRNFMSKMFSSLVLRHRNSLI